MGVKGLGFVHVWFEMLIKDTSGMTSKSDRYMSLELEEI